MKSCKLVALAPGYGYLVQSFASDPYFRQEFDTEDLARTWLLRQGFMPICLQADKSELWRK